MGGQRAGAKRARGGGGIFKTAALAVLRGEQRLMTTGEITRCCAVPTSTTSRSVCCHAGPPCKDAAILALVTAAQRATCPPHMHRLRLTSSACRVALDQALVTCQGRTPEATMASALYTDVKRKLDRSLFTRYSMAQDTLAAAPAALSCWCMTVVHLF